MREGSKRIWTVPNALTMLRLLLIPVYWVLMMSAGNEKAALIVFVAASLTDLLDGYIARKYDMITDFGKLFDPLADKLMVLSVMTSLTIKHIIPWPVLTVILIKELLMIIGSYILLKHEILVYAKSVGKVAQFTIVVGLILSFFHESFTAFPLHLIILGIGTALTVGAFIYYLSAGIRALRNKEQDAPSKQEV